MNNVIIRILDTDNSVLGDLDLKNFTDFPLVITKGIVNLDNLKARTGTYTKTFKVPNTKNNANLLNSVDDINSRKDYKDALNRKPCVILSNDSEIGKGFVQVSKVYNGFELDSFELVFFGDNIDWVKQAADKKVREISFRNNAQVYDSIGIRSANSSSIVFNDHCYPYISRGGNEGINDTQVRDYFPCFYLTSIIERGLADLGWRASSAFIGGTDMSKLVCDLNSDMKVSQPIIDESKTRASTTGDDAISNIGYVQVTYDNDSTLPNEDSNDNYNTTTHTYTAPTTGRYNITLSTIADDATNLSGGNVSVELRVNGIAVDSYAFPIFTGTETSTKDFSFLMNAGDELTMWGNISSFGTDPTNTANIKSGSYFLINRNTELVEGDSFNLTDVIPDDITLLDIINDFTRMFNIYYWTDIKTKKIYFEPRDNFFEDQINSLDWSDKLDLSNKYEVDYVSSYKRNVEFKYKDVKNDEYIKTWQDINKRIYGKYNYKLPDRFAEGTTKIELDLFSASYAHIAYEATPVIGTSFDSNRAFTTLKYWNEYINSGAQPEERIDSYNARIFFFQYGTQTALNGDSRGISLDGINYTDIPYGIFEDYNNTTTPQNLNFATGDTTAGLFETYYSKMFKNIEESGRLIAYFNLDSVDIENLDFRKLVYIDYPAEVKGYYLVESVIDFNPIKNGLTKVSLFKFEDLGSVPIDSSEEGINDSTTDSSTGTTLEPIYIEDGINLIEVWIENPITGALLPIYK